MVQQAFVGKAEYAKGLEDVITNESSIGHVDGVGGRLIYRGFDIEDLAEHSNFEETSYLLLFGDLPTRKELDDFKAKLVRYRPVPRQVLEVLRALPRTTHPMAMLRTGISALGCYDP
jgi:citrate synthase